MTVIKGKDLIIMADGVALAAAKSCDIEVNCEAIPVSSPTSGDWEDSIPGRKSWKVTTNHLLMSAASMLLKVSQIVTLRMKVADGDALPFDGYVSNVTITQQSYTPTSSSKYFWDTTRKKFVVSNGATLNTKYYLSWSGGYEYMNPEMRLFSYNGEDLPDMIVALTQPDGRVITGSDLDNLCRSGRTVRTYTVTNPMSGQWHLSVTVPENNSIAYVYDKVYSLAIGSSISVAPDVADLHVNGTATFTATLTQRGNVVTDALAYEGYECRLEITDLRTNKPVSYPIANNNGVFAYDLPLQEYGSYSARIVFSCDGFSVTSSSIPYELLNHEPTITGTVNKTVKYGPFQDKTTELDLSAYFDDVEDGKDLTIELLDSDCDEDAFKLKGSELILTNAEVGSGSIILSITDSQGAGGEMKVNITAKNTLPIFIAIAVAILILIAVIVIMVLRGREGMNLKGELTVTLGLEIENEKAIDLDLQIPGREAANKTNLKSLVNNALVNEAEKVKPGITNGMVKSALSPYMGGLEQITLSKVITRDGGKRSAGIQIKQGSRKYTMPGKRMVDLYVDDMSVSLVYARPMDEDDDVFGTDDMGMSPRTKSKKESKKADKSRNADFDDDLF